MINSGSICGRWWRAWGKSILLFIATVILFRCAVFDMNRVPSGSMLPTLVVGDRIAVNRLAYGLRVPFTYSWLARWEVPRCGDVIVFYLKGFGSLLVKRVIGVPGDVIEMRANRLIINGQPVSYEIGDFQAAHPGCYLCRGEMLGGRLHPIYVSKTRSSRPSFGPIVVPEGHYFVMGDNRDLSKDSRSFGCIPVEHIVGQATTLAFSLDNANYYLPRRQRYCCAVP